MKRIFNWIRYVWWRFVLRKGLKIHLTYKSFTIGENVQFEKAGTEYFILWRFKRKSKSPFTIYYVNKKN